MSSWHKSRYSATLFTGTYFPKSLVDNCNSGKCISLGDFKAGIHLYHLNCKIPFKKENVSSKSHVKAVKGQI